MHFHIIYYLYDLYIYQITYSIDSTINVQIAYIFRANDFSAKFNFKQFPHIFVLYFNKRRNNNEN